MGLKVKIARIKKGLTQEELANLIGCSPATINRAEKENSNVRIATLKKIAKALDVSILDFFSDED